MTSVGNKGGGKLTDTKLKALKAPKIGQTEHSDSDVPGLRVRVGKTGAKTFILRKRVGGKIKNITLGRYGPRFGIAEARRKARVLLSDLEAGKAPPTPQRRAEGSAGTIRALVPAYLTSKAHLRSHGEIKRILDGYVLPEIGDRFADSVTRAEITALIDGIAESAPTMARAVHAQLSAFYTWALPRLDRLDANPCRDAGRPGKPKARDRVLSDAELAALWQVASDEPSPWGPGLKLLMLTGARRDEVFSADRAEFDLKAKEWIIPAERAKNGVPHLVPLSEPALQVLKQIPEVEGSEKLFPARSNPKNGPSGFSKAQARFRETMDYKLEREGGEHWTLHDIRRTVATGLQRLGVRFEVTEAVLNHVSGARGGIAGVYQRHDWKVEKRAALDAWARHLEGIVKGVNATNVVAIHG
ncbi:tyrosine-type recombinase/integrase [Altericroceibacterium xinjiangense]|uniref:tyrosine-type recombinase/integrase n=1 Tax=Altericroceibacterium xinjiangense TaxID=762261 RepID=UPI0013E0C6A4|nr:site-specific integrase [Altericroceibacterium xinjiangense]